MRLRRLFSLVTPLTLSAAARAQSAPPDTVARFAGTVVRDSAGGGGAVANARVVIPRLGRETVTDAGGAFRIDGLPAGSFEVNVRAIGVPVVRRLVVFEPGETLTQQFALGTPVARLSAVRVEADSSAALSPALQAFEERRHARTGGHFVTPEDFRRANTTSVSTLLASKMPGLRIAVRGATTTITSARVNGVCPISLYIDGLLYYDKKIMGPASPDFSRIYVNDYVAAEFYTAGSVPSQYNPSGSVCGTLLLWSKTQVTP